MLLRVIENGTLSGANFVLSGKRAKLDLPLRIRFADRSCSLGTNLPMATTSSTRRDQDGVTLQVSSQIRETLHLPATSILHAAANRNEWVLGPCLALYATLFPQAQRRFGEQTVMFRDMSTLGRRLGVDVVVVTPGFLRKQTGWRYHPETTRWQEEAIPVPDLVLRRSGTFRKPWTVVNEELAALARSGKLHTLPRMVSNKWLFYKEMKKRQDIASLLPESQLATTAQSVWKTLVVRRDVYVKPLAGAQGVSVYRLRWQNGKAVANWEERSSGKEKNGLSTTIRQQFFNGEQPFRRFWRQTGLRQCIVQETISLPRTRDNRPFDFRWLVQTTDEPKVIARVARLGRAHSVTTNIHTGGEAVDAEEALKAAALQRPARILAKLDHAALAVAAELRRKYGAFAELGVDLALRDDGRVVVFEVNPTPGRRMLRSLTGAVREMSLEWLLEYAIRATGFDVRGDD